MKVFIINLQRSKDRRKRIEKHLNSLNIPFEFFDAVDGLKLSEEDYRKYCNLDVTSKNPVWFTKGMIGACLSHYFLYRKIADEGYESACILEDDVVLNENFREILNGLEIHIQEKKFILLHYTSWQKMVLQPVETNIAKNFGIYEMKNLEGLNSAAGFALTGEMCKRMADFILPIQRGADSWTEYAKNNIIPKIYCVYPKPVNLVHAKSTIDYIDHGSLKHKVLKAINDYKLFPLYQLLKHRRKMAYEKMNRIEILK
jgi:glycosyl transferase family 25